MQPTNCVIIEDEEKASELLKSMLEEFCEGVVVKAIAGDVQQGVEAINKYQPDLVFLDIEMPRASGFSLFDHFDQIDFEVIFTTAYGQYAIKAIKLAALDYLMKPIHLEELMTALDRFRKQRAEKKEDKFNQYQVLTSNVQQSMEDKKIAIPTTNGYIFYKIEDIVRCQSDKGYTMIKLKDNKEIWSSKGLSEYDNILSEYEFLRVHRSHLINPKYIEQFIKGKTPTVVLTDGSHVSVTSKRDELLKRFLKP